MFQATRRRLALWYTVVTAVLLLLFASGFYIYVRGTLIERVDDTLSHVVEVVQRSLVVDASAPMAADRINLQASFGSPPEAVEDDRIDLEWYGPTGVLLWSTFKEPIDVPIRLSPGGVTVEISPDYWLRQVTRKLTDGKDVIGFLRVSHPWFEVTKPARQLVIDLSLGTSLLIALVAAVGWFLSRLAIEPIQESYQQLKQFTADASHELRNPIALIQTNVQVALTETDADSQDQRQQLMVVERLTQRLGRLVDDLLFLARQEGGVGQMQMQPCPLDALLMQVVEEQDAIATTQQINLSLDLGDLASLPGEEPYTLLGDYDQLARLFTNLVSNSLQYTPVGGSIEIHLQQTQRQGLPYLKVDVSDTGIGIPDTSLPYLFNRFYRVDPARRKSALPTSSGTGLGLAIVQTIIENHQGHIQVVSRIQQGTTFTVSLPQPSARPIGQTFPRLTTKAEG
ncbi:Sensor histidine kinase ResE [Acaryochloris thomasi RCC1774]|uniref:histidine kinase n=1 Tax=Acaryochloris thomasi RCC1774 TaxID=1764569 RepID=A0A2W1JLA6_9CYAN|nr:HAMP domain-containing sensor histidine kinase [Acaryochloris thomasi]PZD74148.1 Sensor histidine kinase ResE [Acaryochloris thomasi RCC1774]